MCLCSPTVRLTTCGEALLDVFLVTLSEMFADRPANIGYLCSRLLGCLSASPSPSAASTDPNAMAAAAAGGSSSRGAAFPTSPVRLEPFFAAATHLAHRLADLRLVPVELQFLQLLLVSNPGMKSILYSVHVSNYAVLCTMVSCIIKIPVN